MRNINFKAQNMLKLGSWGGHHLKLRPKRRFDKVVWFKRLVSGVIIAFYKNK